MTRQERKRLGLAEESVEVQGIFSTHEKNRLISCVVPIAYVLFFYFLKVVSICVQVSLSQQAIPVVVINPKRHRMLQPAGVSILASVGCRSLVCDGADMIMHRATTNC